MRLNQNFKLETVAGENMLVRSDNGSGGAEAAFSLSEPAAWLWQTVKDIQFDENKLVELLTSEYDVSAETALADVRELLNLLALYGMLVK